jgi:fatty-acyl-CoA synthase
MSLRSFSCGPQTKPLLAIATCAAFNRTTQWVEDREALVARTQNLGYTHAELAEEIDHRARCLLALGLQSGGRF